MKAEIKQIKIVRNKVSKNWGLPDHRFEALLEELYPRLSKSVYDDSLTLEFLIRYLEIYKSYFESGEGLTLEGEEAIDKFYDRRYTYLKQWIIKKKIEVESYFSYNLLIINYEFKNWVDQDYQVEYLEGHLAEIDKVLRMEEYLGDDDNPAFHINNCYQNGEYPDIEKFNHQDISTTMSLILFKKFLKERLSDLKSTIKQDDVFKIKGSLNTQEDNEGNLVVTLPVRQIVELVKKEMEKESPKESKTEMNEDMKYYTSKQVCEMLQVSLQTLNEWRKGGIITANRIGDKQIRFSEQDIQKAIKKINVIPFN